MNILDELRSTLRSNGAAMVGVANLNSVVSDARYDFPIGISIAVALCPQIISEIENGPTKRYFTEYERANNLLDMLSHSATQFLTENGFRTKWLPATISANYDPTTLSSPLPHKTIATRAGLGWIGKCALLITKQFGSAVRITTVLTDAKLPTNHPLNSTLCGKCISCVDACPGHAPSGKNWQIGLHRDEFFNAYACQKNAGELAKRVGVDETICGICIAICPWTQKYIRKANKSSLGNLP